MVDTLERRVEGTYVREDGHGVHFLSESDDNGKGKLHIMTMEEENLIYVLRLRTELTFISVVDKTLLYFHSEEEGDKIYRVTPSRLIAVLKAVKENNGFNVNLLRAHLPRVSEEEGIEYLNHILDLPDEIQMIIDAAKMMGEEGMSGEHNPALRVFFAHARSLEKLVSATNPTAVESDAILFVHAEDEEQCTTFPTTCPAGECPFVSRGNNCFGMCGFQCNCWEFLCGDCCTYRGCIEHDECCSRNNFFARLRC